MGTVGFRLLTHDVELVAPSRHLPLLAGFFATAPEQHVPCLFALAYSLTEVRRGEYELREAGDRFASVSSIDEATLALDERLRGRVLDYLARGGWLLLAAASGSIRDGGFLVLGERKPWRDVLLASLLVEGLAVDAGEVTLIRGGELLAFPLPIRVATNEVNGIPPLANVVDRLPTISSPEGTISAVDPRLFGSPWRIAPTRPTSIFVTERAPESQSSLGRLHEREAVHAVLQSALHVSTISGAAQVREVTELLRGTQTYRVAVGSYTRAAALMRDVLAGESLGAGPRETGTG